MTLRNAGSRNDVIECRHNLYFRYEYGLQLFLKMELALEQGSQTLMYQKATFQSKNATRATVYWEKAYAGHKVQKSSENWLNLIKIFSILNF